VTNAASRSPLASLSPIEAHILRTKAEALRNATARGRSNM
jgi:hypothetical protein